jgi:homoserine kinase
MMITSAGFEALAPKLMNPETTSEARRLLAAKVRDSEVVYGGEYSTFLRHFFPASHAVLTTLITPQHTDNVVQKTRNVVLETLNRLPHNNALKERAHQCCRSQLMSCALITKITRAPRYTFSST